MKKLIFLLGLSLFSCNPSGSDHEVNEHKQPQEEDPNYEVAIHFINDYVEYCNDIQSEMSIVDWVSTRGDVTNSFKNELQRILDEAEKEDAEVSLGFDPILNAQDNPDKFVIDKKDAEFLNVKGVDWTEFRLTMKLKQEGNKWFVDGSGIINIPEDESHIPEVERTEEIEVCNCNVKEGLVDFHKADISFNNSNWKLEKLKLQKLDIDSLNKVTRSIRLHGFDTIPKELGSLENINTALVSAMNGVTGLDVFPKLKVVRFWGSSKVSFDENEAWLRKIEVLRLEKTQITNLSSISLFENLKQLEVLHSGFEGKVPDFDELKCLNKLYIRAYIGDVIQLDEIDLREMPCLEELYLLDVYSTLSGVPENIRNSNLNEVYVRNENMTDSEKQLIEDFQNR